MTTALLAVLKKRIQYTFAQIIKSREVREEIEKFRLPVKPPAINLITNIPGPYGSQNPASQTRLRDDIVFITGRFRSGSTALWNAFRSLDHVTAYYEPFNERMFFNKNTRGADVDKTHLGVDDYSVEYDSVNGLDKLYKEEWTRHDLYMDENHWNADMVEFIETLVASSTGRPVLQFNRIDFRLPWIRKVFPNATIVHLWRDPRDQWCSTLQQPDKFPSTLPAKSVPENFYLRSWVNDLKRVMPFLHVAPDTHPYQLFYYLWKASYLFGKKYGHTSISYESLTADTNSVLNHLISATELGEINSTREAMKSALNFRKNSNWHHYADSQWFKQHEDICELNLSRFFDLPETTGDSVIVTKLN